MENDFIIVEKPYYSVDFLYNINLLYENKKKVILYCFCYAFKSIIKLYCPKCYCLYKLYKKLM